MAEDGYTEHDIVEEEDQVRKLINESRKVPKVKCRTRFDVLSTPHKRAILDVYQNHAHHFPKEKVQRLKTKLQELYAMTPEETEKYFEQMRKEAGDAAKKKMIKVMLKNLYRKQQNAKDEKKAFRFVEKLLKKGMMHAFSNPIPPLISVRLRNLSDIILEQICDLRDVDIPKRENPDPFGLFLLAVSDWMAIAVEHVYYTVQLKKNRELAEIEKEAAAKGKEKKKPPPEKKEDKSTQGKQVPEDEGEKMEGDELFLLEPDFE